MQKSPVFADSQPAPRLGVFVWKADLADWSHPTGLRKERYRSLRVSLSVAKEREAAPIKKAASDFGRGFSIYETVTWWSLRATCGD